MFQEDNGDTNEGQGAAVFPGRGPSNAKNKPQEPAKEPERDIHHRLLSTGTGSRQCSRGRRRKKQRKQRGRLKRTPSWTQPLLWDRTPPTKLKKATRPKSLERLPSIPPNNNSAFGRESVRSAVCDAFQNKKNKKQQKKFKSATTSHSTAT